MAAADRYRVELIVFRNLGVPAEPVELSDVRRFRSALELVDEPAPSAPVLLAKQDGAFANIWARLDRLADYEPLLRMTFEQSLFDFHPPVRVHGEEALAQERHFPGDLAYVDPSRIDGDGGWFDAYVDDLYRVDGTIQLRRSRFLHIDLDLEYRLDGEAWTLAFPPAPPARLPEGFEWLGEPPDATNDAQEDERLAPVEDRSGVIDGTATVTDPLLGADTEAFAGDTPETEPFRVHRLDQSRQIRTNTMQYFDSAFLGAIVRVTPISDNAP